MLALPHLSSLPKAPPRSYTTGFLPRYIDPAQPPTKRQPFAALHALQWVSSLDLMLPRELVDIVAAELEGLTGRYAKVIMKLGDLLHGELFTEGIKRGNVMVMSEGRKGVDNRFELFDAFCKSIRLLEAGEELARNVSQARRCNACGVDRGILRLELDKATYERAGLQGKPLRDGGLKHKQNRYAVEINLRQPSMLHGKKGFERIIWACKNVLDQSLTWLFCIRQQDNLAAVERALESQHPRWLISRPAWSDLNGIEAPLLLTGLDDDAAAAATDVEYVAEVEEWLSLVLLDSPRIREHDKPDPFICRYSLPSRGEVDETNVVDLTVLRWHGFLPTELVLRVLLRVRKAAIACPEAWWGLRARGMRHEHDVLSVLGVPPRGGQEGRYLCWHSPN